MKTVKIRIYYASDVIDFVEKASKVSSDVIKKEKNGETYKTQIED